MSQTINTNVSALFAGAALNTSQLALSKAQQQLSSGLRINTAADDPTGLGIAMGIQSNVNSTNQGIQNANNSISNAQINDGYLAQVQTNLQRLNTIAVELGGTASGTETLALQAENSRLMAEVTVNGAAGGQDVTIGATNGTMSTYTTIGTTGTFGVTGGLSGGTASIANLAADLTSVSTARAQEGADMSGLASVVASQQTASVNLSASYNRIMNTDYAAATTAMTTNNILQQAGMAVLAQANQTPNQVLTLLR
jgi:flagellin